MKYTYKIFLTVFTLASLLTACDLDVNDDPNRVTETTVTGELIFPAAAHETGQRIASGNFTFLNNWLGYWSGSGTFAIDATETTYNITPSFGNALWQNHYNTLFDLEQARAKSEASGDQVLAGASMILAARLWQDLVDIYGNIPYSQAFKFAEYPQPAYDKGQDIYNDLQQKLDLAISYMGKDALSSFATVDIVNKGDKAKWIKFANTLKLRLLIRQSEISGFDPSAEIAKIKANGGVLGSGETVSVNPGYTNATNKQSPFYANYGLTVNGADAAPSVRANEYFVDILGTNEDPRLTRYFTMVGNSVVGTVYGLASGNPSTASGVGPGLATSADQNQWIFTSVESLFLKAEAVARGWYVDNDTDPAAAYDKAVTESFIFLNVPNAASAASTYLGDFPYTGDIKDLIFQKYISMAGIAPLEAWSDLRRLGFDIIPEGYITVNPSTVSQTIPIRLLYPQNEYTTNAANANAQGDINQFTSKIFWDVN
ncbi:MAG TPA: SusD/RagB family nutrient-binding outer membrane lipoprotein [Ohtaekwangia sp.]|uniref:SusD/RagB family nutrient-binding outer membrane lipoprotein n=1 Tax=Ohtaekwangia sp. TaxID=2066019 RepID=UPI002F91F7A2